MSKSSQDYAVYMPENGHHLSGVSELRCGDLVEVSNLLNGTVDSTTNIKTDSNSAVEIHRFRSFNPSELEITVPEEISPEIARMRAMACMVGVQRRLYCENLPEEVHHYGWTTISSDSLINGTSIRSDTGVGVPTKSYRGRFGLYHFYNGDGPKVYFRENHTPIQVEYCDDKNCSPCDSYYNAGCANIFSLWETENGERRIQLSRDGGDTWGTYLYDLFNEDSFAIHCYQSTLLVARRLGAGLPNIDIVTDAVNGANPGSTVTIKATVGLGVTPTPEVNFFASSGNMLYAAWDSDGTYGVDRSIDGGITWDTLLTLDDVIITIDAVGSNLAILLSSQILLIRDNGNGISKGEVIDLADFIAVPSDAVNLIDVSLALPDFTKRDCPAIYILDNEHKAYVTVTDGKNWEKIFENTDLCAETTPGFIETSVDGYGVWLHRSHHKSGQALTLKNMAKGLDCDWLPFSFSKELCLSCGTTNPITSCALTGTPNVFTVELNEAPDAGQVTICLTDDVHEQGYIYWSGGTNYTLTIFSDTIYQCVDLVSLECVQCFTYPCKSWHQSAFALCPCDPNQSIVIAGSTCEPEIGGGGFIVKDVTTAGEPTELISGCDDYCAPLDKCD